MRIKIILLLFSAILLSAQNRLLSYEDPTPPSEPVVEDLKLPDIEMNEPAHTDRPGMLVLIKGTIGFSDKKEWQGTLHFSNNLILSITNTMPGRTSIQTISLYSIERIIIEKWEAIKMDNDTYYFQPILYKIITNQSRSLLSEEQSLHYQGNIPLFNRFGFSGDTPVKAVYSIFYDRWISGKKQAFRWENSKSTSFSYNFDHPIQGVVTTIQLDQK